SLALGTGGEPDQPLDQGRRFLTANLFQFARNEVRGALFAPCAWPSTAVFAPKFGVEPGHTCEVAARLVEACDETVLAGVVIEGEDNRNRARRCLGCDRRIIATRCNDYGHLTLNQIDGKGRHSIRLSLRPSIFNRDILAFDIAGLTQALTERGQHRSPRAGRLTI